LVTCDLPQCGQASKVASQPARQARQAVFEVGIKLPVIYHHLRLFFDVIRWTHEIEKRSS